MQVDLNPYYLSLEACNRCPSMPDLAAYRRLGFIRTPRMKPIPEAPRVLLLFESPGLAAGGAGRTGKLTPENDDGSAHNLRRYLDAAGLGPSEVAYANAVSCPAFETVTGSPSMRAPTSAEIRNCASHVLSLVDLLGIGLIGAAGRSAIESLLGRGSRKLTDLYRRFLDAGPLPLANNLRVVPLFHTSGLGIANIRRAAREMSIPDLDFRLWEKLGEVVHQER